MDIRSRLCRDDGIALIVALMAMVLLLALGTALTLVTITETTIAASFRDGIQTLYAADAGIDIAVSDLRTVAEWGEVLAGTVTSTFTDGPPAGVRTVAANSTIDLTDELPPDTEGRSWRLYAYGPLGNMLNGTGASMNYRAYVVVWVAGDPAADQPPLTLFASAFGPGGARRNIEVTVKRTLPAGPGSPEAVIEKVSWRER